MKLFPFVARWKDGTIRIFGIKSVSYDLKLEHVRTENFKGFGKIPVRRAARDSAGRLVYDRSKIVIHPEIGSNSIHIATDSKEIKKRIRRIRPDEMRELENINEQIRALFDRRDQLIRAAWDRGHVVTLKELKDQIKGKE